MVGLEPQDAPFLAGAGLVVAGVVWLQLSIYSGRRGLGAYASQEKGQNSFSSSTFKADKPTPPGWWPAWLRLPELDFVEVYGQAPSAKPEPNAAEVEAARSALEKLYASSQIDEPDNDR